MLPLSMPDEYIRTIELNIEIHKFLESTLLMFTFQADVIPNLYKIKGVRKHYWDRVILPQLTRLGIEYATLIQYAWVTEGNGLYTVNLRKRTGIPFDKTNMCCSDEELHKEAQITYGGIYENGL